MDGVPEPPDLSPLVGCTISRVSLDYQVTLTIASTDGVYGQRVDALLIIEAPFTVTRGGDSHLVDPNEKLGLEATLDLLHREVTDTEVAADESLSLTVTGDLKIHVPRDPHYEAWQVTGRGIQGWIAGPQ
jgi:hypothetical protein